MPIMVDLTFLDIFIYILDRLCAYIAYIFIR